MSIIEKLPTVISRLKAPANGIVRFSPYIVAAFIGYTAADIAILQYRPQMLPNEAPPVRPNRKNMGQFKPLSQYAYIWDRNLLNEDGNMPPPLSAGEEDKETNDQMEAVLSQLPLALLGTIVHFNPDNSIATIQRSGAETGSFKPGDQVASMAEITMVERRRVTFRNLNNRRLEYIEIPDDMAFNFDFKQDKAAAAAPIQQSGRNEFTIQRSEVERLTGNLSEVLQQARMEPRFGPDNSINGFCFVSMQPNTIYQTLGFQVGDCIESVEGEAINSPQKAMEFYQKLRNASNINLGIERDGRSEDFSYTIK